MSQWTSRISRGRVATGQVYETRSERRVDAQAVTSPWVRRATDDDLPTLSKRFGDVAYAYTDRSNS